MDGKERIVRQVRGEEVDRIPKIGGWNFGVRNICEIAGIDEDAYAEDPLKAVIRANLGPSWLSAIADISNKKKPGASDAPGFSCRNSFEAKRY